MNKLKLWENKIKELQGVVLNGETGLRIYRVEPMLIETSSYLEVAITIRLEQNYKWNEGMSYWNIPKNVIELGRNWYESDYEDDETIDFDDLQFHSISLTKREKVYVSEEDVKNNNFQSTDDKGAYIIEDVWKTDNEVYEKLLDELKEKIDNYINKFKTKYKESLVLDASQEELKQLKEEKAKLDAKFQKEIEATKERVEREYKHKPFIVASLEEIFNEPNKYKLIGSGK